MQILITFFFCITISTNALALKKQEVSFKNGAITLKGTLYLPKGEGPFPAVVFVHGSGPETRKNSKYSAKWLASIGYVALAYDKRGSGDSDGKEKDLNHFSFIDLADDVIAAVHFLSKKKEVDKSKIGLHAASQGGWVAPLAASKTNLISFMIIKSASVCSVAEDRIFERAARLTKEGFSNADLMEVQEMQTVEAKTSPEEGTSDEFTRRFEQHKDKVWFPRVYPGKDPFSKSLIEYRKWYATIFDFSPLPYLEQIDIPIFWIFGDSKLDKHGPVEKSIAALESLQRKGKSYEVLSYEGEGHNVKESKYESALYHWLNDTNEYHKFKFKKH